GQDLAEDDLVNLLGLNVVADQQITHDMGAQIGRRGGRQRAAKTADSGAARGHNYDFSCHMSGYRKYFKNVPYAAGIDRPYTRTNICSKLATRRLQPQYTVPQHTLVVPNMHPPPRQGRRVTIKRTGQALPLSCSIMCGFSSVDTSWVISSPRASERSNRRMIFADRV